MSLHPDLLAALAVVPETERTVKLRGHDLTFYPIPVKDYVLHALQDAQTAMAAFGVDLTTGQKAPPEQIKAARETLSDVTAAKIIALSTREPAIEALASNLTPAEKTRCLAAAFAVTTGGDVAGFFADVRAHLEMTLALISQRASEPGSASSGASSSSTVIRSRSSSRPSARSRRK